MKLKKAALSTALFLTFGFCFIVAAPTYASSGCDETTVLTGVSCGDKGEGIWWALDLGVQIFTMVIGVLAIIGVVVAGIRYMTSRDNPEGVTAAKKMLFNIAIGLLAYGLMLAILSFILPGF